MERELVTVRAELVVVGEYRVGAPRCRPTRGTCWRRGALALRPPGCPSPPVVADASREQPRVARVVTSRSSLPPAPGRFGSHGGGSGSLLIARTSISPIAITCAHTVAGVGRGRPERDLLRLLRIRDVDDEDPAAPAARLRPGVQVGEALVDGQVGHLAPTDRRLGRIPRPRLRVQAVGPRSRPLDRRSGHRSTSSTANLGTRPRRARRCARLRWIVVAGTGRPSGWPSRTSETPPPRRGSALFRYNGRRAGRLDRVCDRRATPGAMSSGSDAQPLNPIWRSGSTAYGPRSA
jgi:hypothetical protein